MVPEPCSILSEISQAPRADRENRYRPGCLEALRKPVPSRRVWPRMDSAPGRRASRVPSPIPPALISPCPTSSGRAFLTYRPRAASSLDRSSSRHRCSPSYRPSQQAIVCSSTTSRPYIPLPDACIDRLLMPNMRDSGKRPQQDMSRVLRYKPWCLRRGLVPPWRWMRRSSTGSLGSQRRTSSRT